MYKIDLHTHSTASPDGGINVAQYKKALESGVLDSIAITDHNRINVALQLHAEFGDRIIVGEEIMSIEGEIIGLFLSQPVQPGQSAKVTMDAIKSQGGLVYIPHPFETVRKGLHPAVLESLVEQIDIVEVCNGRAFVQNKSEQALVWAKFNRLPGAASSDAHGLRGLGRTYTSIPELPTVSTLPGLLARGIPMTDRPSLRTLLYPKYHRLRKFTRQKFQRNLGGRIGRAHR